MEDCPQWTFPTVKMAHRQVLQAIDYKRLRWSDTEAVYKHKTEALHRVHRKQADEASAAANTMPAGNPCQAFQTLSCPYEGDHSNDTTTFLHCCAFCHAKGRRHIHALTNCRKSKESRSKNGKGQRSTKQE